VCAALAVSSSGVSVAFSQATPGYGGVTPGSTVVPDGIAAQPGATPTVTWPGFQMTPDGGSRVFVQTTSEITPELKRGGGGFLLMLPGVALPPGNARLPLDTHFFKTPVQRVHAKQQGSGVVVTIQVKGKVEPKLRTEKAPNGYFFTYVEFAP